MKLGNRLHAMANMIINAKCVVDVGTDHAYLPIYLIKNNIAQNSIACDINVKPLKRAENNICKNNLQNSITAVQSNGLDNIQFNTEITHIIIGGMGGELVSEIVQKSKWAKDENVYWVLQAMTDVVFLRRTLIANGFRIIKEAIACEGVKIYTIFLAQYQNCKEDYTHIEIKFGKYKVDEYSKNLLLSVEKEIKRLNIILNGLIKGNAFKCDIEETQREIESAELFLTKIEKEITTNA